MKRFVEYIEEAWFNTRRSVLMKDKIHDVYKNPSYRELKREIKSPLGYRALVKGKDILVWGAFFDVHENIENEYGWKNAIRIVILPEQKDKIYLASNYDNTPNNKLVNIKKTLINNKNLQNVVGGVFGVFKEEGDPI